MVITPKDPNKIESTVQTVNLNIKNKKQEILFTRHVGQLNISTYWDSHGKKIPFPGRNEKNSERIRDCDVRIIKNTYDIVWENLPTSNVEDWILEVDGVKIPGDVTSFGGSIQIMRVKLCVGAG